LIKEQCLTTASTLQILCHAACKNNNASCAPSPAGTDLKVKPMFYGLGALKRLARLTANPARIIHGAGKA